MDNKKNGKNNHHFEPDYHCLNREEKRSLANGSSRQGGDLLNRFLPKSIQAGSLAYDPFLLEQISGIITNIKEAIDWGQDLSEATYISFDTETTGLLPYRGDEIIAIGAVVIENNRILEKPFFYQLVNPRRPVSKQSQKITGLTDEMLQDQPGIEKVLRDFLEFIGPRILIAHNAPFDLAFFNNKLGETIGKRIYNPVIDTVLLTTALFYSLGDYSLENLSTQFKLNLEGRHNALADARIAASLFLKLLPELKARGVTNLPQLAGLFAEINLTKGYPLIF